MQALSADALSLPANRMLNRSQAPPSTSAAPVIADAQTAAHPALSCGRIACQREPSPTSSRCWCLYCCFDGIQTGRSARNNPPTPTSASVPRLHVSAATSREMSRQLFGHGVVLVENQYLAEVSGIALRAG